jgi:hypothetical protein
MSDQVYADQDATVSMARHLLEQYGLDSALHVYGRIFEAKHLQNDADGEQFWRGVLVALMPQFGLPSEAHPPANDASPPARTPLDSDDDTRRGAACLTTRFGPYSRVYIGALIFQNLEAGNLEWESFLLRVESALHDLSNDPLAEEQISAVVN